MADSPWFVAKGSPPLDSNERLACEILGSLHDIDMAHRYNGLPFWRPMWRLLSGLLLRPFYFRRRDWMKMCAKRLEGSGILEFVPRPPLPLVEMWKRMKSPLIQPASVEEDTLYFDDFLIGRRENETLKSATFRAQYYVVAPQGKSSFRCIARDSSNRMYHSRHPHSDCQPLRGFDFQIVRIKTKGFDEDGNVARPCVMKIYLPGRYAPWELLKSEYSFPEEEILHDEDDDEFNVFGMARD